MDIRPDVYRLIYISLIILLSPAQLDAAVTCENFDYYLKQVEEAHYFIKPPELKARLMVSIKKQAAVLNFTNTETKSLFFSTTENISTYQGICMALRHAYESYPPLSPITQDEFLESILKTSIEGIDPHTRFFSGQIAKEYVQTFIQNQTNLGITYRSLGDNQCGPFRITDIVPESSADNRGLQIDDVITHINERSCVDLSAEEFTSILFSQSSTFSFQIMRGGIPLTVHGLLKSSLFVPTVQTYFVNAEGLIYCRIKEFGLATAEELKLNLQWIKKILDHEPVGILLDLRSNRGGTLSSASHVIDHFIDDGIIYFTHHRKTNTTFDFLATESGVLTEAPLVILVDDRSASASELVASSLQDLGRAFVVGIPTFGKGSVLNFILTPDDQIKFMANPMLASPTSGLIVSHSLFYPPSGNVIQKNGVIPDIEILDSERNTQRDALKAQKADTILAERDYKHVISAENMPRAFSAPYDFRKNAIHRMKNRLPRTEFSDIEKKDLSLTQALDILKIITHQQIPKSHFGFSHYYKTSRHRLHIETDLYEKNKRLMARFRFKHKQRAFPNFWKTEEILLYETIALITGNEITLALDHTSLASYVEEEESGTFILEINAQKKGSSDTPLEHFSHRTIVTF